MDAGAANSNAEIVPICFSKYILGHHVQRRWAWANFAVPWRIALPLYSAENSLPHLRLIELAGECILVDAMVEVSRSTRTR